MITVTALHMFQRQMLTFRSFRAAIALLAVLLAGCATTQPGATVGDDAEMRRIEARVTSGRAGPRDFVAERSLHRQLCLIDETVCPHIRIYVIDASIRQARLWPNDMLVVSSGLLRLIDLAGPEAQAQRHFALAHELAHRQLGHFPQRQQPGWDGEAVERAADSWARNRLREAGLPERSGADLLARVRDALVPDSARAKALTRRIEAMRRASQ